MSWINRKDQEPSPTLGKILVWGIGWPEGLVAVHWNYHEWCDVVDNCDVEFELWQHAPDAPQ